MNVLVAQQQLLRAQETAARIDAERLAAHAALMAALGGGVETGADVPNERAAAAGAAPASAPHAPVAAAGVPASGVPAQAAASSAARTRVALAANANANANAGAAPATAAR